MSESVMNIATFFNYEIERRLLISVLLIFSPFVLSAILMIVDNSMWWPYLVSMIILFFFVGIRQFSFGKTYNLRSNHKNERSFFSNKWMRRGYSQFVYIVSTSEDEIKINLFETEKSYFHDDINYPFSSVDSLWGKWDMTMSRIATKKEIEKYNLKSIEAFILLGEERC